MKKVVVVIAIFSLLLINGCSVKKMEELTDAEKFANEYSISEKNPFHYATVDDVLDLIDNAFKLRAEVGDRAVMRAYHFLEENERVINQINALKKDDINTYIKLMNESGLSSFMYLQNCYSVTSSKNMGVALGLTLTKDFLKDEGACRVHGGGFAGTIQALIPVNKVEEYKKYMNSIFGEGSAVKIRVRQSPVCAI